jgi:DNA polymerase/3'-5' exonuclease PolX
MSDLYKIYCELNSLEGFKSNSERLLAVQIKAANEVASELRAEVLEQARLLGMGAEREAKLLAEIERLRARVEELEYGNSKAMAALAALSGVQQDAGPP